MGGLVADWQIGRLADWLTDWQIDWQPLVCDCGRAGQGAALSSV